MNNTTLNPFFLAVAMWLVGLGAFTMARRPAAYVRFTTWPIRSLWRQYRQFWTGVIVGVVLYHLFSQA